MQKGKVKKIPYNGTEIYRVRRPGYSDRPEYFDYRVMQNGEIRTFPSLREAKKFVDGK